MTINLVPCAVCGQPTGDKTGVCKRTKVCIAARSSVQHRGEIKTIRVPIKCQICGAPTRSRIGICQKTPACHAAYNNVLYHEEPARGVSATRLWQLKNPVKAMLMKIKWRAKRDDIPFNLSEEDIQVPERCPILGMELSFSKTGHSPNSPSVDRIIPELGYVPGNVWVISKRANTMKQDATPEELRRFSQFFLHFDEADK